MEIAQNRAQNFSDTIIESSFDAIITTDLNGIISSWNDAAEDIYGYTAKESIRNPLTIILPEKERNPFLNKLNQLQKGDYIKNLEIQHKHKSGNLIYVSVTISPLKNENKKVIGASLISHDITFQKNLEISLAVKAKQLEYLNQTLKDFALITSHDLKAPLRAIINLATWIQEDCYSILDLKSKEHFDLLKKRAQSMDKLINGILEYSFSEKENIKHTRVKVAELINDTVKNFDIPSEFKIHLPDTMPTLTTLETPLRQVFGNLINNAVTHHKGNKGNIWITCSKSKNYYTFCVKDDGPGIPKKHIDKVFNLYENFGSDVKRTSGIGLSIVKRIISQFKGKIWVESSEGNGASFYFTLPIN